MQGKACATSMSLEEYIATSFVSATSTSTSAKVKWDRSTADAHFGRWTRVRGGGVGVGGEGSRWAQARLWRAVKSHGNVSSSKYVGNSFGLRDAV